MANFKLTPESLEYLKKKDLLVQDYGLKFSLYSDSQPRSPYASKSKISCITPCPRNAQINTPDSLPEIITFDFGFAYSLLKSNQKGLLCELEMTRSGVDFELSSFVHYTMDKDYTGGDLDLKALEEVVSVVKLGEGTTTSDFSLKKLLGSCFFGELQYSRRTFLKRGSAIPTFLCEYPILSLHVPSCYISHLGTEFSIEKNAFFYTDVMIQSSDLEGVSEK